MYKILIYLSGNFKVDSRSQNKKVGKTSIENMKISVETLVETKLKQRQSKIAIFLSSFFFHLINRINFSKIFYEYIDTPLLLLL